MPSYVILLPLSLLDVPLFSFLISVIYVTNELQNLYLTKTLKLQGACWLNSPHCSQLVYPFELAVFS